jgi:hypothetical protein
VSHTHLVSRCVLALLTSRWRPGERLSPKQVLAQLGFTGGELPKTVRRPTTQFDQIAMGILAAPLVAIGGVLGVKTIAGLWLSRAVPATLFHFTSSAGGLGINATGVINAGRGLYGAGVYLTRVTTPVWLRSKERSRRR